MWEAVLGILYAVIVFGFIGLILVVLMMRYQKMKLKRNKVTQKSKNTTTVVYEKKAGDAIKRKKLGNGNPD
jgi:hypothetical protein